MPNAIRKSSGSSKLVVAHNIANCYQMSNPHSIECRRMDRPAEITTLLQPRTGNDREALENLAPIVYCELRRMVNRWRVFRPKLARAAIAPLRERVGGLQLIENETIHRRCSSARLGNLLCPTARRPKQRQPQRRQSRLPSTPTSPTPCPLPNK
jgi:hypothetical protein